MDKLDEKAKDNQTMIAYSKNISQMMRIEL